MSAFLRASHRLRSMSLVSGYLLSQKGSFTAKVSFKSTKLGSVVETGSTKWHTLISDAELNVVFHPKYGCYQVDIISSSGSPRQEEKPQKVRTIEKPPQVNESYFQEQAKADIVSVLRKKKKFSFVLKYTLNVRAVKRNKDLLAELEQGLDLEESNQILKEVDFKQ